MNSIKNIKMNINSLALFLGCSLIATSAFAMDNFNSPPYCSQEIEYINYCASPKSNNSNELLEIVNAMQKLIKYSIKSHDKAISTLDNMEKITSNINEILSFNSQNTEQ